MINDTKEFASKFKIEWNIEESIKNILDIKKILESLNCDFYPAFGTFLGMYRDGNLIEWDYDTDIVILGHDYEILNNNIGKFNADGFDIIKKDNMIISFRRNRNYTDIYPFHLKDGLWRNPNGVYTFYPIHAMKDNYMDCFGVTWKIFNYPDIYFSERYGDDWKTPIEGKQAER